MGENAGTEVIAQAVGRRRFYQPDEKTLVRIARVERRNTMPMKRSRQKIYVTQVLERGEN